MNIKQLCLSAGILLLILFTQKAHSQPWTVLSPNEISYNTFKLYNDGAFQSTLNSNNAAKIDMGYTVHGYMDFILHTGSGYRQVLHMNGDGYVGIGTGNPNAVLDVLTPFTIAGSYPSQKWKTTDPLYNLHLFTELDNVNGINYNFIQKFNGTDYNSLSFYKGFTGINTTTPAYQLDVNGDFNIFSGKVFRIDGIQQLSAAGVGNIFVGGNAGVPFAMNGEENTFVGNDAGRENVFGSSNTYIGYESGRFFTDNTIRPPSSPQHSANTFVGCRSGKGSGSSVGTNNSYLGYEAGMNTGAGMNNTFLGVKAGFSNVEANGNTFIGALSGYNDITPAITGMSDNEGRNTFVGYKSGYANEIGQSNVFSGDRAGLNNLHGSNNVFMGVLSGGSNNGGSNNVMIGDRAGLYTVSGMSNNVFIGGGSGRSSTGYNNSFVGTSTYGDGKELVLLGAGAVAQAASPIEMAGAIGVGAEVNTDATLALGGVGDLPTLDNPGVVSNAMTVVIGQTTRTPLSVGTLPSNDWYRLEVNGAAYCTSGLWTASDQKFKKNIESYKNAMDVIKQLKPVMYLFRDDVFIGKANPEDSRPVKRDFPSELQIGFLAQDLEKILPQMVRTHADGSKAVNYQNMYGILTQGLKEEDERITKSEETIGELKTEIVSLSNQNIQLISVIDDLQRRLDGLEQKSTNGLVTPSADTKTQQGKLEQNEPNPFTDNTVIKYWVPQTAKVATIIIRSDKALEVMKFSIEHKGNGNIIVSGNTLTVGGYNCELYIDGKLADSKKMILVK